MNNEQAAALLEVFSFFFVGIDLYGPERLGKAQSRLLISSEYIHSKIEKSKNYEWKKQRFNRVMIALYALNGLVTCWLLWAVGAFDDFGGNGEMNIGPGIIFGALMGLIFFYFFAFMFTLLFLVLSVVFLNLLVAVAIFLLQLMIKILRSYHMEGVFLFIGTALFLISKYVQFYY